MIKWYLEIMDADQWGKITLICVGLLFGTISVLFGIGIALINFMGVVWAAVLSLCVFAAILILFPYLTMSMMWLVTKGVELSGQNGRKGSK